MASIPKPETILLIILLDMSRSEKEIKDDHLGGSREKDCRTDWSGQGRTSALFGLRGLYIRGINLLFH